MRIITGRFRRRKLLTNPGLTTRPISDRVKQSLFEYLGDRVQGARIADIFAGTGTLGLEALSRGARSVVCYELDAKAHELMQENVAALGVEDEVICWRTDVTKTSFRPRGGDEFLPYDIIFFDPPYRIATEVCPGTMLYRSLQRLSRPGISSPNALLLFRTPERTEFQLPEPWYVENVDHYSNMDIHWICKHPEEVPGDDAIASEAGGDDETTGGENNTDSGDSALETEQGSE